MMLWNAVTSLKSKMSPHPMRFASRTFKTGIYNIVDDAKQCLAVSTELYGIIRNSTILFTVRRPYPKEEDMD